MCSVRVAPAGGNARLPLTTWLGVLCLCAVAACNGKPAPPPGLTPQLSGTIAIAGLSAPVRVVRDPWGVPHIYAESAADLFTAQGFVQAEDRLFQMDLWRRSAQGRLSQVLGPNFIERDAMTRRFQYRGDLDAEWASYGPDTKAIAMAFVRGVNAWVTIARARRPEAFVVAGWSPEFWSAIDLVNRTDAFVESGDAVEDARRAHLGDVVVDAIRRVGTPPFFVSLARPVSNAGRTDFTPDAAAADAGSAALPSANAYVSAARGGTLAFGEAVGPLVNPSTRYLVHLKAPGWNVIGVTRPWLPGVAVGHNERIAWGMTPFAADTQDLYVEPLHAPNRTFVNDVVVVKGRAKPFAFVSELTPHGAIVASDRQQNRAFAVRWSGSEPGGASELGALALDRAQNWTAFRTALVRWRMPARQVAYADADGNVGLQVAAFIPERRDSEWRGWTPLDDLPHVFNPRSGSVSVGAVGTSSAGARSVQFTHVLGITDAAARQFDVGPVLAPTGDDRPVHGSFDTANWDRSRAMVVPGQSDAPESAHFRDLAAWWSRGQEIPLPFTDAAVEASAATTLTLVPRR
ncbi:MAG TPA: penicillin acylase family protein [Vicinamibacterales bacterium]|nr:penicillin acylase family protein [Vicinamibacterales bacterium]